MRLPRQIDDRLKDAIVSIQFVPGVPPVTVLGYAHASLKGAFNAVTPNQFPAFSFNAEGVTIDNRQVYFASKDGRFRIDMDAQSITFNIVQGYTGWAAYRTVIADCLTMLMTNNIIQKVNRLGVRYISQFNNVRIGDSIDIVLGVEAVPNILRSQLRLEFSTNDFHTILTLVDGYPTEAQQMTVNNGYFSLVDLDIIKYYPQELVVPPDLLINHIDAAHHEQKLLFFKLLKEDFLTSLNPQY